MTDGEGQEIEEGDHVTIGNGNVHWVVIALGEDAYGEQYAHLRSGLTDRWAEDIPLWRLTIFQKHNHHQQQHA